MAQFIHRASGVTVTVDDEREMDALIWEPAEAPKKAAPKRAAKADDSK